MYLIDLCLDRTPVNRLKLNREFLLYIRIYYLYLEAPIDHLHRSVGLG